MPFYVRADKAKLAWHNADSNHVGEHDGTLINKPEWVIKKDIKNAAELNQLIVKAEQKLTEHPEGSDVGQAPVSARIKLKDAITVAQKVVDEGETQQDFDTAAATLEASIDTFEKEVIQPSPSGSATALWTDYGDEGFWTSAVDAINTTKPNDHHNLLAFTWNGETY